MPIDFLSEMSNVLDKNIPQWFYQLPVERRNNLMNAALTRYTSITIAKNNTFLTFWANTLAQANHTILSA